jgi:lipopolysaccharide export system permease protein
MLEGGRQMMSLLKAIPLFRLPYRFYGYILSEVSKPFLGAVFFFTFVLMMFQVIRWSDFFVVHNVSGYSILTLMWYLLLTFTPVIFPIAFLLAVLLGFGRLSGDSEVLAMRAAGLSVYSMLLPVLALGAVLTLVTLICNMYFVPYGSRQFRYELFRISNTKAIATIHEGTFNEGFFDMVLFAGGVDSKNSMLSSVLIYDERKDQLPVTVVAKTGQILNNLQDDQGVPGLVLRLFNGSLHRGDPAKRLYEKTDFDLYDIFLRIETAKVVGVDNAKTMDSSALKRRIEEVLALQKQRGGTGWAHLEEIERLDYINYSCELYKRYALSLSCLIFAMMGVAFGVVRTRAVRSNSFIICLVVLLVYYMIYSYGFSLASEGKVPAFVGIFAANVVAFLIAIFTLRKVAR